MNTYVTSFCNFPHVLKTGRPIDHECYILPPAMLEAERNDNHALANEILARVDFKRAGMVKGRPMPRARLVQGQGNVYDKPFTYNKQHRAYVVKVQDKPDIWEVTLEHGDRALPHGMIHATSGQRTYRHYIAFLYKPDRDNPTRIDEFNSREHAIGAIRLAWEQIAQP